MQQKLHEFNELSKNKNVGTRISLEARIFTLLTIILNIIINCSSFPQVVSFLAIYVFQLLVENVATL